MSDVAIQETGQAVDLIMTQNMSVTDDNHLSGLTNIKAQS